MNKYCRAENTPVKMGLLIQRLLHIQVSIFINNRIIKPKNIEIILNSIRYQFEIRIDIKQVIISVLKNHILPFCLIQSEISRCRGASIFLMENPDAAIPRSIFIAYLTGLVLAAVINEKALEIGESLGQDAVHTASQG